MLSSKTRSPLNSTKTNSSRIHSNNPLIHFKLTRKYISVDRNYQSNPNMYQCIDSAKKNNRLWHFLKDQQHNDLGQNMEQYYNNKQANKEINTLIQYYKYYTQTSILYQKQFFKLMHQHRQRKKLVQYNRLKIILDLSDSVSSSTQLEQPIQSFYFLSKLNISVLNEQSQLFARLNRCLQTQLGPAKFVSLEQLDKNFWFQNKIKPRTPTLMFAGVKAIKEKENLKTKQDSVNFRNKSSCKRKRNNTLENMQTLTKPFFRKRKQQSMDNLTDVFKQYTTNSQSKMFSAKMKTESSKIEKTKVPQNKNIVDMKQKITDLKAQIRRQKAQLKKKMVERSTFNNNRTHKKTSSCMNSPKEQLLFKKIKFG